MLGGQRVERAREPLERFFGVAEAEVARLLQGCEGLGDARDAELVGGDVEVGDGVADELGGRRLVGEGGVGCGGEAAYGGGVFFEEHFGGLRGLEGVVLAVWIVGCSCWLRTWAWGCWS